MLGLGLNNFAVYYEFVTGRPDFGPHSFYVATIVETGLVGTTLLAVFLSGSSSGWGSRAARARAPAAGDPLAARVRPLAWGMTAALVATMAANIFYLTMTFYYFYVFATLAVAVPAVFGRRLHPHLRDEDPRPDDVLPALRGDFAGVFVKHAVDHLRGAGVEVEVVSPASFRHFGLAYGHGIVATSDDAPGSCSRAAVSRLVCPGSAKSGTGSRSRHAHWLPSAIPALGRGSRSSSSLGHGCRARQAIPLISDPSFGVPGSCSARRKRSETPRASWAHESASRPDGVETPAGSRARRAAAFLYVGRLSEEGVAELLEATGESPRDRRRRAASGRRS